MKARRLTPTQARDKVVSVLRSFGYGAADKAFDMGRPKAWLKPRARACQLPRLAQRITSALNDAGLAVSWWKGYGGEVEIGGPGVRAILNQDSDCTDVVGGAFVEAWSTAKRRAA